jgi:hypothetical protein
MLPEKLALVLKNTHQRLLDEGRLPSLDKLQGYYDTFRARFGPDVLSRLDGEELLRTMHDFKRVNRNTLVYWLEFKNDEEFPYIFGSISGGSALKYGVYPDANTGVWKTRDASNYPVEITLTQAIEIAQRHRDQLMRGVALLEKLPVNGNDTDYQALQHEMDEQAPDVSKVAWGHKYFSLLYPDKLDNYHRPYYQRFHLVKLLQPNLPSERAGHYITAGRFVAVARELDMPMNHLNTLLNIYNGKPYHYWSVLISDTPHPESSDWKTQRDGGFATVGWSKLPDLSNLKHNSPSKKLLHELMEQVYPRVSSSQHQGVFDFVTDMAVGDRIVVFDSQTGKVMGVGKVVSNYYFEPSTTPHRRAVEWYNSDTWRFSSDEGFERSTREILLYANQVEIECRLLDAPVVTLDQVPEIVLPTLPIEHESVSREEALSAVLNETVILVEEEETIPKIFISYRRRSWAFTHRLADELGRVLEAEIFVDVTGVDDVDFERSILRNLRDSDVVLLIISEHTFEDRIHQPDDWVRREIREALNDEKPLVLVCIEGRLPPPNLPEDIRNVARMQGINFYPEYFRDAVERLARFVMTVGDVKERTSTPVDETTVYAPPVSEKIVPTRKTLDEALRLMDEGEFSKAVPLLNALHEAGYKSRNFDLDKLILQAQTGADQEDVRRVAKSDYEEIVMLAARRVTLESARAAFARWCEDNSALVDELDTEKLRQRFAK